MTEESHERPLIFKASGLSCPRCGSSDVYYESGMYGGRTYLCKQCGYRGSFVIEWDEDSTRPDLEQAPGYSDDEEPQNPRIPLWVKGLALLFLLYILFLRI